MNSMEELVAAYRAASKEVSARRVLGGAGGFVAILDPSTGRALDFRVATERRFWRQVRAANQTDADPPAIRAESTELPGLVFRLSWDEAPELARLRAVWQPVHAYPVKSTSEHWYDVAAAYVREGTLRRAGLVAWLDEHAGEWAWYRPAGVRHCHARFVQIADADLAMLFRLSWG